MLSDISSLFFCILFGSSHATYASLIYWDLSDFRWDCKGRPAIEASSRTAGAPLEPRGNGGILEAFWGLYEPLLRVCQPWPGVHQVKVREVQMGFTFHRVSPDFLGVISLAPRLLETRFYLAPGSGQWILLAWIKIVAADICASLKSSNEAN